MTHRRLRVLIGLIGLAASAARAADPEWLARSRGGMVASDSPEASQIGAAILRADGNAFDAALATSFALGVSRPQSTGLGGGGFMLAYLARERRFIALDFRETAPADATPERFAQLAAGAGSGPSPCIYGGNAVATPGLLAGLAEIHRRLATRPLKELMAPAIQLAEAGFIVDEHYRDAMKEALADFAQWPQLKERHKYVYQSLLGNGTPPEVGERVVRPDLALGLRLIAEKGPDAFYKGPLGEAAVKAVQAAGGVLCMDDLAAYRLREREPLRAAFKEYEIVSMPPPSSGGACLIEALHIVQAAGLRSDLDPTLDRPHVLVEAMKHAFADRARWFGDPDFCTMPLQRLNSLSYAAELARRIHPRQTLPASAYGGAEPTKDDGGTSHFNVVDKDGNVVALTETINGVFGSLVVAEPYGIILNNEMDDFATAPGQPNLFGLVQSPANSVAPGKRPLSSMAPTIVLRSGRPLLALGASGGPRIISSVLQVMLNVIDLQMPLDEALSAVRLHHQWQPDEVYFDRQPPDEWAAALSQAGHKLSTRRRGGAVQAIQILDDGTLVGASDPRKGGRPAAAP